MYEYVAHPPSVTDLESVLEPPVLVVHTAPAPVIEYLAPALDVTLATPAAVIKYAAPAQTVTCTSPSPVTEDVAPVLSSSCAAPASVTSDEASQVVDSVPLLPALEYIAPASPVTNALLNQPSPPAFTSCEFLERLTEQVVAAPSPQDVKEVVLATVNELITAVPADEFAPDDELDEARQRIKLRRVFDAALAESTAQELLADEVASKPLGSPATEKAKKGRHKK